jgi:hypothetical protein
VASSVCVVLLLRCCFDCLYFSFLALFALSLLNQQQKEAAEKKALVAQVKQLIQLNIQAKDDDGVAYNFSDKNAVKKIHVNQATLKNISNHL